MRVGRNELRYEIDTAVNDQISVNLLGANLNVHGKSSSRKSARVTSKTKDQLNKSGELEGSDKKRI
jgi:hypothetical protein